MKIIFSLINNSKILLSVVFTITFSCNVTAQSLPSATELLARASVKTHPRTIDVAALKSEVDYDGRWIIAQNKVSLLFAETLPTEPVTPSALSNIAGKEQAKILLAAAVWLRTGNSAAASEAKRRALNIASWSTTSVSYLPDSPASGRNIAGTIALVYDWLYDQWTPAERAILLSSIQLRLVDILGDTGGFGLNDGLRLLSWPYDSLRSVTQGVTAVTCTILAGKGSLYDQCVINIVPRYLARPIPWGRDDGGYSQGVEYAQWDVLWFHFEVWRMLKESVNVDIWRYPWAQNYGNFLIYFLPPGSPSGVFGDGAEKNNSQMWATQSKVYAGYLPSPLSNWYARNQSGEVKQHLTFLLAPQQNMDLIPATLPSATSHGIHIPSIGWAAMHSNLDDKLRTSIYFKSSPYGSYSHSHADQNSFVIHARGKILAVDSGYYDSYGSAHWRDWYTATKAHNAITFDGGQGQLHNNNIGSDGGNMRAYGSITQFGSTSMYDVVTGDARAAYDGQLTKAVRSIVFLRPNTILIFDSLASDIARTWEWNIHALNSMMIKDSRNIELNQDGIRLCIRQLSGPEVGFYQTNKFTSNPDGLYQNQWHGTFSSNAKSKSVLFVTVLEVGCENAPVTVTRSLSSLDVSIFGNTFTFDGAAILKR